MTNAAREKLAKSLVVMVAAGSDPAQIRTMATEHRISAHRAQHLIVDEEQEQAKRRLVKILRGKVA